MLGLPRVGSQGSPAAAVGGDRGNWGSAERLARTAAHTEPGLSRAVAKQGQECGFGTLASSSVPTDNSREPTCPCVPPTPQPAGAASPGLASASSKYSQNRQHLPRTRVKGWVSLWWQSWGPPKRAGTPQKRARAAHGPCIGCRAPSSEPWRGQGSQEEARGRVGDGWAGVPGPGPPTSGPSPHNRLSWGAGGWGKHGLAPSLSRLKPHASRGVPGFTLQFIMTLTSFHFLIA